MEPLLATYQLPFEAFRALVTEHDMLVTESIV
jgi:hypothetical protein